LHEEAIGLDLGDLRVHDFALEGLPDDGAVMDLLRSNEFQILQ
jgi:hypothetical protein